MVHDIQEYEVTFEYILGKKNAAADALSGNIGEDTVEGKCPALCNVVELTALDETLISSEQRKKEPWKSCNSR